MLIQIEQNLFGSGIFDQRSRRDANLDIGSIAAGHQLALSVRTTIRLPVLVTDKIGQAADVLIRDDDDVAAVPTLAPIRTTERNMSLAPEAHATVTSVACLAFNSVAIDKHGGGTVAVPSLRGERLTSFAVRIGLVKRKTMWAAVLIVPLLVIVAFAVMSATSRRPDSLGVRDGRLAPCPDSPNCVSTQANRDSQRMDAVPLTTDAASAIETLRRIVTAMPRTQIVTADGDYLHAEFTSALFRFVDDVEFFVDRNQHAIHFRSASRAGHSDFGVNRKRMQAVVAAFQSETARHEGSPKTDR